MKYGEIVKHSLEVAHDIYRKYLLGGKGEVDPEVWHIIRLRLRDELDKQKGIGWLSIYDLGDYFVGKGGAWVCINVISRSDERDNIQVDRIIITIFTHQTGASFANIIVLGCLDFESGEIYNARLQANGSYTVYRDGKENAVIANNEISLGLENKEALRFASKFGIPTS